MRCSRCLPLWIFVALVVAALGFYSSAEAATATLTWQDNATNEAGYHIERSAKPCTPAPNDFVKVGEVAANVASYVDNAPVLGNKYCWRVRAYNFPFPGTSDPESAQYSGYSNLAGKDFPLPPPSAAPSGLTAQ